MPVTIQSGAHQFSATDITKYSLMMGGLNVTHDVLKQYDPLVGGYYRLFVVRDPTMVQQYFSKGVSGTTRYDAFKHILEYGNLGVSGLSNTELEFSQVAGGYAGRQFDVPTVSKNGTTEFSIKVFEFSGSPIREVLSTWINGIADENAGFAHYNGLIASGDVQYSQANHTAEFMYIVTDRTGMKVEFAAFLANCMPKNIPYDQFNAEAGTHELTNLDLTFTTTMYTGMDVNEKAKILLKKNQIMVNSIEFCTGLDTTAGRFATSTGYNPLNGKIDTISGDTIGSGTSQTSYRTSLSSSDSAKTKQSIDVDSITMSTPSYTDIGNRM